MYVEKVELNGKEVASMSFTHDDLINGGELTFYMSKSPKK